MWYSRYFFVNLPSDSCSEYELIMKYLGIRELMYGKPNCVDGGDTIAKSVWDERI